MGSIVAAAATSHVVMDPTDVRTQAGRVIDGFKQIAAEVARTRPDLLLYITSDHMVNLGYRLQPSFALGCADSYTPLGDMQIPRQPMAGHPAATLPRDRGRLSVLTLCCMLWPPLALPVWRRTGKSKRCSARRGRVAASISTIPA
jgi:hypothetical protein